MQLYRALVVAVVVAAVAISSFVAGMSYGTYTTALESEKLLAGERERIRQLEAELASKQSELNSALNNVDRLEALLSETKRMLSESEERLAALQTTLSSELENLRRSNSDLSRRLSSVEARMQRVETQVRTVSQAIPILNQLRGVEALGPDRNATMNYWLDIKGLVASFEPALTPSVDRVINNVNGLFDYYDWIERYPGENASAEEIVQWLLSLPPSYQQYVEAVNQFIDELLTSLASKLSALRDSIS
jgi:septation ring formation regulator EzrA